MPGTRVAVICLLAALASAAVAQDAQERERRYYEQLRRERERAEAAERERQRELEHQRLLDQRQRDREIYGPSPSPRPQGGEPSSPAKPGSSWSAGEVAVGAGLVFGALWLLEQLAKPSSPTSGGAMVPTPAPEPRGQAPGTLTQPPVNVVCIQQPARSPQSIRYTWVHGGSDSSEFTMAADPAGRFLLLSHPWAKELLVTFLHPLRENPANSDLTRLLTATPVASADTGCPAASTFVLERTLTANGVSLALLPYGQK